MINKVILIGNVGADPEIHTFETGNKIARVRVATTERIFNPATNTWSDHTEWHHVVTTARNINFVELYVRKGSQVYIEGRLRRREWGEGDNKRFTVEIRADEFRLLGRRADNGTQGNTQSSAQNDMQITPPQQINPTPVQQSYNQPQPVATPQPTAQAYHSFEDDQTDDIPF